LDLCRRTNKTFWRADFSKGVNLGSLTTQGATGAKKILTAFGNFFSVAMR